MKTPVLSKITLFPVKALSGVDVERAVVTPAGALRQDRQFALQDEQGRLINAKRHPEINQFDARFDLENRQITLDLYGFDEAETFDLYEGNEALETWFSDFFGFRVRLIENADQGFPDDRDRPGPTLISTATLAEVHAWFPDLTFDEIRKRFRTNLEIADCPAFWEDRLNKVADDPIRFKIGDVLFEGLKHCVRCQVPTLDTRTGEAYPDFQKIFMQKREETLPDWIEKSGFDHFYRLAINTRIVWAPAELQTGTPLLIL